MAVQTSFLKDAAGKIGVAPITLKRWLLSGKVDDVKRNRNGWRIFTHEDIKTIKRYADLTKKPPEQMPLANFGIDVEQDNKTASFRDSAFNGNKKLPFHRWVPWIAGFSAGFVEDCFQNYLKKQDKDPSKITILDPFAGVGTTLIEGLMHGYNVAGFEINPYAYLASKVKLRSYKYDADQIKGYLEKFLKYYDKRVDNLNHYPKSQPPEGFKTRSAFYSPKVERKVMIFYDYLANIKKPDIRDLFKLAFGAVMVRFSNYSYEPSLGRRVSSGKSEIFDANVEKVIAAKIEEMISDIIEFDELHSDKAENRNIQIYNESIFDAFNFMKPENIDLLVTSPPYLNNYHYMRNTRPQLHWLDLAPDNEMRKSIENKSFGKFWQTVRGLKHVPLAFSHDQLEEKLETLRQINPDKKTYGGSGWANYAATYFNDSYRFCKIVKKILKPNGIAVIVLGNSILQGIEIKTDEIFAEIGERTGLVRKDIVLLRNKRTGSSIVDSSIRSTGAKKKTILYETAVILGK